MQLGIQANSTALSMKYLLWVFSVRLYGSRKTPTEPLRCNCLVNIHLRQPFLKWLSFFPQFQMLAGPSGEFMDITFRVLRPSIFPLSRFKVCS